MLCGFEEHEESTTLVGTAIWQLFPADICMFSVFHLPNSSFSFVFAEGVLEAPAVYRYALYVAHSVSTCVYNVYVYTLVCISSAGRVVWWMLTTAA